MGERAILLWTFLLGVWVSGCLGLANQDLYPFGSQQGDRRLNVEDDVSSPEVVLNTSIAFYDELFDSLYVNSNGFVSFETDLPHFRSNMIIPFGFKMIAPFFADIDTRLSGNIYYRETFDPSLRGKVSQEISRVFPGVRFYPNSLFIATWDQVGYYDNQYDTTNTFQMVLASDGRDSFSIFLYPEGGIGWVKGQGKESPNQEDPNAQAGFDSGDNRRYLTLPGSGNPEAINFPEWSNVGVPGVFIYRIGNTRGQNVGTPSSETQGGSRVSEEGRSCADGGQRSCHANANCVDYAGGHCCECRPPTIGNGVDCVRPDEPLRISGKVSGTLNGIHVENVDLHAYILPADGRTYTAISRMERVVGYSMLHLFPVAGILSFLFAQPQQPSAKNGFMITGYNFTRTTVVQYQPGQETVTIRQTLSNTDVPGHLRLATSISGTIPRIVGAAVVHVEDYREEYRRVSPGVLRMTSANNYRVNETAHRMTVDDTINFKECSSRPLNDQVSVRLQISRSNIAFAENEQIVRFSQTNKVPGSGGDVDDPCRSATCDVNARCVPHHNTYRCVCKTGFEGSGQQCRDIDECRQRTSDCHDNADCFNTDGSYQCRCKQGYTGDGRDCRQDIQPQSCYYLRNCGQNAECLYDEHDQNYVCRCRAGFDGDGYSCSEIQQDECTVDIDCDVNAVCVFEPSLRRYECRCEEGYEGDGRTCNIVQRDCRRDPGLCTRHAQCAWDGSVYACRCADGYHGDGYRQCSASPPASGSYLIYAQGMYIMEMPFTPSQTNPGKQILYLPEQTVIGVDVDCQNRHLYWTDINGKTITRSRLDGTEPQAIVRNLNSPEGVAVDWISRNIYWSDSGSDRIEVSRIDGSHHKTLLHAGLVNPRGIAIDPIRGYLFWTDWNRDAPKIERSNMDGSERRTIISEGLGLPNGLTIDYDSQLVCWADAGTRRVECSSYDGGNRRVVAQPAGYPFGLAYNSDILYWTDWEKPGSLPNVRNLPPVRANEDLTLPQGANGRLYGITTVRNRCPSGSNSCAVNNGGCRFLCLPTRGARHCACPDDIDEEECNRIARL